MNTAKPANAARATGVVKPAALPPARTGRQPTASLRPKGPVLGRPKGKFTQHRKLAKLRKMLEHPQGLTIPEMAAALGVTTRSVRRYISYLSGPQAPDELESVAHGPRGALRWRVNARDRGRAMNLRRTQAYGLLALRRGFDALRGSALYEEIEIVTQQILQLARRPVRAGAADIASDTRMEERFVLCAEVAPARARGEAQKGGELDDVFRAVADLRVLTFRYLSGRGVGAGAGRPTERGARMTVHPYAMVLYRGEVHCVAWDVAAGRVEVYALSRMRESEPSESARFELPEDFNVDEYVHGPFGLGRLQHAIVVEFSAQAASEVRAQRLHSSQRIMTAPDGRVRLSLNVPSLDEALAWVLRHGSAARVIEPPELRDAVMRELKGAMLRYGR